VFCGKENNAIAALIALLHLSIVAGHKFLYMLMMIGNPIK